MTANGLRPYQAYKDSGLDWMGTVPEHWQVRRVASIADMRVSNVDKHVREEEETVRLCNYVDVYHNDRIREDISFMPATAKRAEIRRFRMAVGDVLLTKDSEDWKDIGVPALVEYAGDDLVCGYHLAMLRPCDAFLDPGYLFRALGDSGVAWQFRVAANGVTRYGLSRNAIRSVRIPLPPVVEQRAIARYLDHADRRIRRYIRAKEWLIELLEERKRALVHEAVTGRIDVRTGQPYRAYKDSGIEWLGKVPEHWSARRLKTALSRNDSGVWGTGFDDEGVIVLRSTEQTVRGEWHILAPARRRLSAAEYANGRLEEGDLVVTTSSGSARHIGKTSIVSKEVAALDCCFSNFMQRLRATRETAPEFLWYVMNSQLGRAQFDYLSNTTTGLANLSGGIIGRVALSFPPQREQHAIVRYLDAAARRIQRQISATRRQIALVEEHRTRLIADVVTGKLDVREAAADLPETYPLATNCDRAEATPTESNLHSTEHDMAKEASA